MSIDPELAAIAATLPTGGYGDPRARREQVLAFYERVLNVRPAWAADVEHHDVTGCGVNGEPPVRLRIFLPRNRPSSIPGIVWFHGGGFITGHLESDSLISGRYAAETRAAVVHVDYRLAPEDPYPAAVHDGFAALTWAYEHGYPLGIDRERLIVAGSSAGGGLAAGIALMARDLGGPTISFLHLLHPALDDRCLTSSARQFTSVPLFTSSMVRDMWNHYLGHRCGTDDVPVYAAPGRADDLSGLPPTYLMTAGFDPLRDEGAAFATHLMACGVDVEYHNFAGAFHAFLNLDSTLSHRAQQEQFDVLRRVVGARAKGSA